ncbi:restriction endonuclease subunit S [Shewanella baltica]|uniref:restriction endonuclease subunit S n=1 Tax=Shewanella baltica TaxID=62322 RepID=UPI00217EC34D|nr:restriction endonuclease subunit S [Shewanella baltica]MCS6211081.1 restriction endonuclease subunit S [Shewanella baltica]
MSQLNYLEKLLDGVDVEWKPLDDISVKISSGGTPKTGVAEFYDGDIPWLRTQEVNFDEIWDTGVKITEAGVDNSSAKWIPANCVIVAMYGATVGKIGINKIPMTTNQACANIQLDGNIANYRYVFHFLLSQYEYIKSLGSGSQTNINAGIVKKLVVPIPCPNNPEKSLAIQAEIVRILDAFTAMTAELTAELIMRKKQYNYYRDQLLSFEEGEVEWKTLGDVAVIGTGKHDTRDAIEDGDYIFYARGREPLKLNTFNFDETAIITAGDGAGVGKVYHYAQGKYALHQRAYRIVPDDSMHPRFVYHYISAYFNDYIQKASVSSSVTSLRRPMFLKFTIPVPPLSEQSRIVEILEKFDTLTTSIQEGLPREIELRQKQYEYYRDLLLSFPKSHSDEAA